MVVVLGLVVYVDQVQLVLIGYVVEGGLAIGIFLQQGHPQAHQVVHA